MTIDAFPNSQLVKDLGHDDIEDLVRTQLGLANYLVDPTTLPAGRDLTFTNNVELWNAILDERVRANSIVNLRDFYVSEWFPRTPGVFHTREALALRREAMDFVVERTPELVVFNPYGKIRMLRGGVGSIRLKPKTIKGSYCWFMSASSTLIPHEGFPLVVSDAIFAPLAQRLAEFGCVKTSLSGRLQFLPEELSKLVYESQTGVPQLYLAVEELLSTANPVDGETPRVSIPATFRSEYEGHPAIYATYVSFNPQMRGDLDRAVEWLQETYVTGMYAGIIVSDFDEQRPRFADAVMSLERVMRHTVQGDDLREVLAGTAFYGDVTLNLQAYDSVFQLRSVTNLNQERVINIGAGATISAPVLIADTITNSLNTVANAGLTNDIKTLVEQLLREIVEAAKSGSPELAVNVANDADSLSREIASERPRRTRVEVLISDIRATAEAMGEVAIPVVQTITKLAPLLAALF